LQFIVSDVDDELYDSALVIDNIRTSAVSANPEPGSLTLAAVGAISLLGYRLRRRRARA
jgi:MYXO-CTERM domain-containing protein